MKIVIFGYWFGSGNIGDQAILLGIKKLFREHEVFSLLSRLQHSKGFMDNLKNTLGAYKDADIVIVTGGTPFYDYGHLKRMLYMLLPKLVNKPVILFSVGTKKIESRRGRLLISFLVNNADLISVRDPVTKKEFEEMGVRKKVVVTGDSSLVLDPSGDQKVREIMDEEGIEEGFTCICPRKLALDYKKHYHQKLTEEQIAQVRRSFKKMADYSKGQKVIIPFHKKPYDNDLEEIRDLNLKGKILKGDYTPQEIMGLISKARKLIGLRLHSLIFAYKVGVPFQTINYDIKIQGFQKLIGDRTKSQIIHSLNSIPPRIDQCFAHA